MLYSTPPLSGDDHRVLDEIAAMREDLRHVLRATPQWAGQMRRNLTARNIQGTNTIEGYSIPVDDVQALMVGDDPLESTGPNVREIQGYQEAMTYIQALADDGPEFRYEAGLLNGLHFMMQGHHLQKRPGRWRTKNVYISHQQSRLVAIYTAPEAAGVGPLMSEFIDWLNEGDLDAPVHVRASMAHLNLAKIHPWMDGNGRMSRALSTLVFSREALLPPEFSSIEEWLGYDLNTLEYYAVLREVSGPVWSPERDAGPWLRFCLRAHHLQAQEAKRRVDLTNRAWGPLVEAATADGVDERAAFALLPAFSNSKVRRTMYQQDAELSEQQAIRDMRELVRLRWLVAHGNGRNRFYTAGPRLAAIQEDIHGSSEPYAEPYR